MTARRHALQSLLRLGTAVSPCRLYATQRASAPPPAASNELYDVVVIGGGPAGCALAAVLGSLDALDNKRIALVDSGKLTETRQWEPPADTYLSRTLQITSNNKRYLAELDLWQQCFEDRVQAYSRAIVTDALGGGAVDLLAELSPVEADAAFMVETKNLVSGMLKALN
ncbi:putative ubiquinone biosynthesis monooxygenase, partial [Coemansia sp. RSA 2706]